MKTQHIGDRKDAHLDICLSGQVRSGITTGLEAYRFTHRALPEIDLSEVSTRTRFLGHAIGAPLLVGAMTGGTARAEVINRNLAAAAAHLGIPMVVGSQRVALNRPETASTFTCVRELAPDVPLGANLGAIQFAYGYTAAECRRVVEMIRADFLVLHLNPLQEALQPEGQTNFRGVLAGIRDAVREVGVPVVVKEVGHGLSAEVARELVAAGVRGLDVAGAGGTSWTNVEGHRGDDRARRIAAAFAGWGIPTAEAVQACRAVAPEALVIASGGITTGMEAAKALALGADCAGLSAALLPHADRSAEEVIVFLEEAIAEVRLVLFALGLTAPAELAPHHLVGAQ